MAPACWNSGAPVKRECPGVFSPLCSTMLACSTRRWRRSRGEIGTGVPWVSVELPGRSRPGSEPCIPRLPITHHQVVAACKPPRHPQADSAGWQKERCQCLGSRPRLGRRPTSSPAIPAGSSWSRGTGAAAGSGAQSHEGGLSSGSRGGSGGGGQGATGRPWTRTRGLRPDACRPAITLIITAVALRFSHKGPSREKTREKGADFVYDNVNEETGEAPR